MAGVTIPIHYTLDGVAFLLRVSTKTLRRWVVEYDEEGRFGVSRKKPVFSGDEDASDGRFSFEDLIELLYIKALRDENFRLKDIRDAVRFLETKLGKHPLSKANLMTVGKQLLTNQAEENRYTNPVLMQHLFEFADELQPKMVYVDDKLTCWYPEDDQIIRIRPDVRFGKPTVPEGISTTAIYSRYKADGDMAEATAEYFDIPVDHVEAAIKFEEAHQRRAG